MTYCVVGGTTCTEDLSSATWVGGVGGTIPGWLAQPTQTTFTAGASANLDGDPGRDQWLINATKNLTNELTDF